MGEGDVGALAVWRRGKRSSPSGRFAGPRVSRHHAAELHCRRLGPAGAVASRRASLLEQLLAGPAGAVASRRASLLEQLLAGPAGAVASVRESLARRLAVAQLAAKPLDVNQWTPSLVLISTRLTTRETSDRRLAAVV